MATCLTAKEKNILGWREVPVEVVQRMFMDSGLSRNLAARNLGWVRQTYSTTHYKKPTTGEWVTYKYPKEAGDVTRLGRTLGWSPRFNKDGEAEWSSTVHYDTAVTLCRAWGLDPVDYGI